MLYIFIFVCLVLSKTPIKLYSQRQLLVNNNYNSFCIFIIGFASFSQKPLLKFIYEYELSRNI